MTEPLRDALVPGHVTVRASTVEYRGHIIDVVDDDLVLESTGARMSREYVVHADAVAVVPIRKTGDGRVEVLLIRQYRHPVRSMLWEIPAGLLDVEGEEPLVAAARELAEEVDLAAETYDHLATFFTSPGCSTERLHVYMATGLSRTESDFVREDEEAEIVSRWFPLADVLAAVDRADLGSPTLVVGVLAAAGRLGVRVR